MQRANFMLSPSNRASNTGKSIVGDSGSLTSSPDAKHSPHFSSSTISSKPLSLRTLSASTPVSTAPSPSHLSSQLKFSRFNDKDKGSRNNSGEQMLEEIKEPDDEVIRRLYGGNPEPDDSQVSAAINLQAVRRRNAKASATPMTSSDRKAMKLNSEQSKWLDMRHISNLTEILARPGNERPSMAQVRLHNLCKGELDPYGLSLPGGVTYAHLTAFSFNAFVQANMRPGHVRFLGRAPWGRGLWAGIHLLEAHTFDAPLVDFSVEDYGDEASQSSSTTVSHQRRGAENPLGKTLAAQAAWAALTTSTIAALHAGGSSLNINTSYNDSSIVCTLRPGHLHVFEMDDLAANTCYFVHIDALRPAKAREMRKKNDSSGGNAMTDLAPSNIWQEIDDHAIKTTKQVESTFESLIAYLTKLHRIMHHFTEKHTARAIFRWVCHYIRFDRNSIASTDPTTVLRIRSSTAEGIANLYSVLCTTAGLPVIKVKGLEKQSAPITEPGATRPHWWNIVKADDKWELVDCAFSSFYYSPSTNQFEPFFSEAYFGTSPQLFLHEHYPLEATPTAWPQLLSPDHTQLALVPTVKNVKEWEKALQVGRSCIEHRLEISPPAHTYEAQTPSFRVTILGGNKLLFDAELQLLEPTHRVYDLSQCSCVQYMQDNEVRINFVFPAIGKYALLINSKPAWRETDMVEPVARYVVSATAGMNDLMSAPVTNPLIAPNGHPKGNEVMIGYLQSRKVANRDGRAMLHRSFTIHHPMNGNLLPHNPTYVQISSSTEITALVIVSNGNWIYLQECTRVGEEAATTTNNTKYWEGRCIFRNRTEVAVYYQHSNNWFMVYSFNGVPSSEMSVSNSKLLRTNTLVRKPALPSSSFQENIIHGKCTISADGRCFDASLNLDMNDIRFGNQQCTFFITCSNRWEITVNALKDWKNGQPCGDQSVFIENAGGVRDAPDLTKWRVNLRMPTAQQLDDVVNANGKRISRVENTQIQLIVNCRMVSQGGPFRFALAYYFETLGINVS